jgi:hypothetical protein
MTKTTTAALVEFCAAHNLDVDDVLADLGRDATPETTS